MYKCNGSSVCTDVGTDLKVCPYVLMPIFFIIIIFYAAMLRLPPAIAEEHAGLTQQITPVENSIENRQPSISRNPFVSAPYGRMSKATHGTGTNGEISGIRRDSSDALLKSLRLRGVLISNDNKVALLGHKIVKIGDVIDDYTITEIADDGVVISKGDTVIRFTIE